METKILVYYAFLLLAVWLSIGYSIFPNSPLYYFLIFGMFSFYSACYLPPSKIYGGLIHTLIYKEVQQK